MIATLVERFTSWRRERRIRVLSRAVCRLQRQGDSVGSRVALLSMSNEIKARTPQQVLRMERARGLCQ